MIPQHPFWWLLAMACLAWYSLVTAYVAVLGARDIRTMLRRLQAENASTPPEP